jgi:hypothetical protein
MARQKRIESSPTMAGLTYLCLCLPTVVTGMRNVAALGQVRLLGP